MNYALLPPEINSGRMYTGPGAAPMLAVAAAFDAVAAELESAAAGCATVLTELAEDRWTGPTAQAAITAGTRYATWLRNTAMAVEDCAMRARSAVGAYEAAFAATVPPAVVAENRLRLATLVATNFFGQNTAAIAATEAEYSVMWAQDAVAMSGYAAAAAAARQLPRFDEPPPVADPAASAAQGVAAGHAGASNAHALAQLGHALSTALQQPLGSTLSPAPAQPGPAPMALGALLDPAKTASGVGSNGFSLASSFYTVLSQGLSWSRQILVRGGVEGIMTFEGLGPRGVLSSSSAPIPGAVGLRPGLGGGFGGAVAGMGHATPVGRLSVPPTWTAAAPELRSATLTLTSATSATSAQAATQAAAPALAAETPGLTFQQALMGTFVGQGRGSDGATGAQRTAAKTGDEGDSDGQRVAAMTGSSAWLGSARAHHERLRPGSWGNAAWDGGPSLRRHWRADPSDRPA